MPPDEGVVPIERLARREQRFRCPILQAVFRVETCIDRQSAHGTGRPGEPKGPRYPTCARCDIGAGIRAQIAPVLAAAPTPPPTPSPPPPPPPTLQPKPLGLCTRPDCTRAAARGGRPTKDPDIQGLCLHHRDEVRRSKRTPQRHRCIQTPCRSWASLKPVDNPDLAGLCKGHREARMRGTATPLGCRIRGCGHRGVRALGGFCKLHHDIAKTAAGNVSPPVPDPTPPAPNQEPGTAPVPADPPMPDPQPEQPATPSKPLDLSTRFARVLLQQMLEEPELLRAFTKAALADPPARRHLLAELARDLAASAYELPES